MKNLKNISMQVKISIIIIILIITWIVTGVLNPKEVVDKSQKSGGGEIIFSAQNFELLNTFKTVFGYGRIDRGEITITSEVNSHVTKINNQEGDNVKKGDKIIELLNGIAVPAPITGTLDDINVKIGDIIFAGQTKLFSVISNSINDAIINVPVSEARLIKKGQNATLQINGMDLKGVVYFVSQVANKSNNTFQVKIKILNPKTNLFQDETIKISIQTIKTKGIFVPTSALSISNQNVIILTTINKDGIVNKIPVKILNMEEEGTWVSGKFENSTMVILRGGDFAINGEKVKYKLTNQ